MAEDAPEPQVGTARKGIRSSMTVEQQAALAHDSRKAVENNEKQALAESRVAPEVRSTRTSAESANRTSEEGMLNPLASQTDDSPGYWHDTAPPAEAFSGDDARKSFLRAAVHAYRSMLVGLRTQQRQNIERGFAGTLNPEGMKMAEIEALRITRQSIAKSNAILAELEDASPFVEP